MAVIECRKEMSSSGSEGSQIRSLTCATSNIAIRKRMEALDAATTALANKMRQRHLQAK